MHSLIPLTQGPKRVSRGFIITILATLSTTAVLSILLLAFKADSSMIYNYATGNYSPSMSPLRPDRVNGGRFLAMYPYRLFNRLVEPTLVAAGVSLFLALGIGLLSSFVLRRGKALLLSNPQRLGLLFLIGANWILSVIVCLIGFVYSARSGRFDPSYRSLATADDSFGPRGEYDGGIFDLASWSCQISTYTPFYDGEHVLPRQCIDETAVLWLSLLLALSNLGVAGLVWMDWRGDRLLIRDNSGLGDDYAEYIGERELFP